MLASTPLAWALSRASSNRRVPRTCRPAELADAAKRSDGAAVPCESSSRTLKLRRRVGRRDCMTLRVALAILRLRVRLPCVRACAGEPFSSRPNSPGRLFLTFHLGKPMGKLHGWRNCCDFQHQGRAVRLGRHARRHRGAHPGVVSLCDEDGARARHSRRGAAREDRPAAHGADVGLGRRQPGGAR